MKNGVKHVGRKQKAKRSSLSPKNRYSMNMCKNIVGYKRKRTSKSPKKDDVGEQVPDVHIDDIEEHQWVDQQGKNLLCFITYILPAKNLCIFEFLIIGSSISK
jgi:SpoVK/Ycf46/Vps4 family AAA+-type ATPase